MNKSFPYDPGIPVPSRLKPAFDYADLRGSGSPENQTVASRRSNYVHAPLEWFAKANSCPEHSAAKVAPLVWFLKSVTRQPAFPVSNCAAKKFGLDRKQKAAGLKALEAAGLIRLAARTGKSPLVSLGETWQTE
jgi:hypothetical protein